jgi:hypothetical protein
MPKRSRGTGRPGQRPPIQRSGSQRATPGGQRSGPATGFPAAPGSPGAVTGQRSGALTTAEEARAAELEAQILADEQAANQAQRRTRDRARTAELAGPRTRDAAPLAVRAAGEYAYVRRDITRIGRAAALLLVTVVVLHVLINVMGVISV